MLAALGVDTEPLLFLLIALIGETLEAGREVTGARVVDKSKGNKTHYRLEVRL